MDSESEVVREYYESDSDSDSESDSESISKGDRKMIFLKLSFSPISFVKSIFISIRSNLSQLLAT